MVWEQCTPLIALDSILHTLKAGLSKQSSFDWLFPHSFVQSPLLHQEMDFITNTAVATNEIGDYSDSSSTADVNKTQILHVH
jgi:hypothetical protein